MSVFPLLSSPGLHKNRIMSLDIYTQGSCACAWSRGRFLLPPPVCIFAPSRTAAPLPLFLASASIDRFLISYPSSVPDIPTHSFGGGDLRGRRDSVRVR